MIALAALLLLLLIGIIAGISALELIRAPVDSPAARIVYGAPLGLGMIAYLILALGLLGELRTVPVIIALATLTAVSLIGIRTIRANSVTRVPEKPQSAPPRPTLIALASGILIVVTGIIALVNCFVPPATNEWDALSYHLAAPKIYLQEGRIVYLPTDHHSNFPFSMQMLFMLGLLFNGYALANLIHFAMAALTVAALFVIGSSRADRVVRWAAAAVFVTCPLAVWQAGTAYVELGFALFVITSIGALLEFKFTKRHEWLTLCALLLGFALSVKTLALIPMVLIFGALAVWKVPTRRLAAFLGIVLVVGCPFYLKSWIVTGNPVYPFGYQIFGGRDWSAELAETYASEHRSFGQSAAATSVGQDAEGIQIKYQTPNLADRLRNLALAPFEFVAIPRIFHNFNNPGVHSHIGFLVIALLPLLLFVRAPEKTAVLLSAIGAAWFLIWSQSMQYARYLLPLVPLLAVAAGEGAVRCGRASKVVGALAVAAFGLQSALTLSHFGHAFPNRLRIATNEYAREHYLTSTVNVYGAEKWLNNNTRPREGVVLFEETRGFYLDRPYIWGNGPHSLYIPYHQFETGQDMSRWFLARGFRYAIVNLQFSPHIQSEGDRQRMMISFLSGTAAALVRDWYSDSAKLEEIRALYHDPSRPQYAPNRFRDVYWRLLLGDAVANGGAVVNHEASSRGAVVLEFRQG
jgi:hypothetical protein